jgi:ribose-phosphate pyrophosphokinase
MDGLSVPAHGFKLIAGPANPELCAEIAQTLDVPFCKTTVTRFADGEIFVRID